ncbi:MAG: hypothetical protein HY774_23080 [Acidobacteria bacterium]|nr:hypothetical protein [Acidobacteriota bacterium]
MASEVTSRFMLFPEHPLDDETTNLDVIRPELNLEKWPALWQPIQSKNKQNKVVIEREVMQLNNKFLARVVATANSEYGPLTTEDQKLYYALQKIWEDSGRQRRIVFSRRRIATILGKQWGSKVSKAINDSLFRLRGTLFVWTDSFYDSTNQKTIKTLGTFNILSDLKIAEESVDGHRTTEECYCEFHELIYKNLLNGYTKPLLFTTVVSFEDGIAQMLYSHLDLMLANNDHYERRTRELFDDLQLQGNEYKFVSRRKRTLERILPTLQDKPTSRGGVLRLVLDKTRGGKDFKLIVERAYLHNPEPVGDQAPISANQTNPAAPIITGDDPADGGEPPESAELVQARLDLDQESDDLVRYFLKTFRINRKHPRPTELAEARELIYEYQLTREKSRWIVDFSLKASKETRFVPKSFNGIVQYTDQALETWQLNLLEAESLPVPPAPPTPEPEDPILAAEKAEIEESQRLETLGEELFSRLSEGERISLVASELETLRKSEHWKVYARMEKNVLHEHISWLVGRKLALQELGRL